MATIIWILATVLLSNVVIVHSQAGGYLSLRACPVSHVEIVDVCNVYPTNQPVGSQGIMRATAWTYNALGCSFGRLRSLFRFDPLKLIPQCANIVSATLQLFGAGPNSSYPQGAFSYYPGSPYNPYGSNNASILRVTQPWSTNTVTWSTQPSTMGPIADVPPSTSQNYYNPTPINVTLQVQAMVQLAQTSYGFMLQLKTEQYYRIMTFFSSLATDVQTRPLLQVNYTIPCTCVPCK